MSRRRLWLLLVAFAVTLSLVGCGQDQAPDRQEGSDRASVLPELVNKVNLPPNPDDEVNVAVAPEMPPPIDRSTSAFVDVNFEVVENVSTIHPQRGTQHLTWGYRIAGGSDGPVVGTPGPVIRARVGDVLRFTITNPPGNQHPHNVDFHAVTGQGGGAEATTVAPGETRTIEARLLYPGLFMYHCAYGDVPEHIAHGMYGGIQVDPAEPLPEVEHEWYVVQSEYYMTPGGTGLDRIAVSEERPSHVVFNGAVGSLTGDNALEMEVSERARIFFVNAGLNLISSFHPIGSHWDVVYREGTLLGNPLRGSQTTLVPAGGSTIVEVVGIVPQRVVLVDHALARAFDRGAVGHILISGEEDPEIFTEVEARQPPSPGPAGTGAALPAVETPAAAEADHQVSIVQGSGEFRGSASAAPDEFAEREAHGDYSVNALQVRVGDTVRWTNNDNMAHTVTATDGEFDSGLIQPGQTWTFTFEEAGDFEYLCTPHPWMRARLVVSG